MSNPPPSASYDGSPYGQPEQAWQAAPPPAGAPEQPPKPRKWPWIAGIAVAFFVGIGIGSAGSAVDETDSAPTRAESGGDEALAEAEAERDELLEALTEAEEERDAALARVEAIEERAEPAEERAPEEAREESPEEESASEGEAFTTSQRNAIGSAESYLSFTAFSRSGLIDQLEYEGYSSEDAAFAVDHVAPDWNEQAARMAEDYLGYSSFSRQGLIDQLLFEGFTQEQAEHGVSAAGY